MGRKQLYYGGTKNKIIEVAEKHFFEKGYDATSIRGIIDDIDCEVGLFYYYYKNKDELYTDVLDNFFNSYCEKADKVIDDIRLDSDRAIYKFFLFVIASVNEFKARYAKNVHPTICWALRERALTYIEPYMEKIVDILVSVGAKPRMSNHLTAIFLSHGVGSILLHEDIAFVEESMTELRKAVNLLMGLSEEDAKKMFNEN